MQAHIDFILELDRLKGVTRKTKPAGLDRYENPAEHSWQIALMAQALAHLAATPVNVARIGPPVEAGCPALWAYLRARLDAAQAEGWFGAA